MPGIGLVLTLFAALFSDESSSDPQLLAEAEAAFQLGVERRFEPAEARGNFLRAAELYEQLRQRGASSPALLRNLGNAYLLAGDVPKAILAYRRGLRVAPSDRRLQEGLSWARSQVA